MIDHPAENTELLALWKDVFGDHGGFWELFLETGFSPDRCRCVMEDGHIAAALCWLDFSCRGQKLAYLYAVMTRPDCRGRGLCRALMADTHGLLSQRGYAGAVLVPAEESLRQMYEKLGYRTCTAVTEFACAAGAEAADLRCVTPEEYGRLRRQALPEGGALQEGASLSFLAAQAELFAGEDFLLAAWGEGDTLHGMELLGDRAAAPGILKALGFAKGTFRTPGTDRPFAMFLPLSPDAKAPDYFGFAFD